MQTCKNFIIFNGWHRWRLILVGTTHCNYYFCIRRYRQVSWLVIPWTNKNFWIFADRKQFFPIPQAEFEKFSLSFTASPMYVDMASGIIGFIFFNMDTVVEVSFFKEFWPLFLQAVHAWDISRWYVLEHKHPTNNHWNFQAANQLLTTFLCS